MNIDTNTVNFAVAKISSAVEKALPTMTSVSQELVRFTVARQVLVTGVSMLLMVFSFLMWIPIHRFCKKKNEFGENKLDEPVYIFPTIIFGSLGFISLLLFIVSIHNTVLALSFPEMFTATRIIMGK